MINEVPVLMEDGIYPAINYKNAFFGSENESPQFLEIVNLLALWIPSKQTTSLNDLSNFTLYVNCTIFTPLEEK